MKRADFDSDYEISFNLSLITLKSVSIEIKIHALRRIKNYSS